MSADYPKRELSRVFNIPRSTYYSYQRRKNTVNVDQERLKAKIISLHRANRQPATKPSDIAENHLNRQFTTDQPNQVSGVAM
jgi:hypothetical protein